MGATTWLWLAIGAGVIAVLYGVFSMMAILKLPAGNAPACDLLQAGPLSCRECDLGGDRDSR